MDARGNQAAGRSRRTE